MHALPGALAILVLVALVTVPPARAQAPADLVVLDAVAHTADPERPAAEAFAVADGRFVAVGSEADTRRWIGPSTTVVEAGGRAVVPGLIDAHAHVLDLGAALRSLDLVGTRSPEEVAALVREAAAARAPGEWILGRGWDQNDWPPGQHAFPTRAILDAAAPDHPVWLTRVDGHAGWANTRAIEAAGVTAATPDPDGGRIVRAEDRTPTGVFVDNAEALVQRVVPPPGPEEREARLAAAFERMAEVGLTGVHDMGVDSSTVELYRRRAAGERPMPRVVAYLSDADTIVDWWRDEGRRAAGGDGARFRVAGVKLYADGALGSRGAALLEPYSDDPGNRGLLVTPPDTLAAHVARALALGLQPAIHAIGDRGNRVALDAVAAGRALAAGEAAGVAGGSDAPDALPPRIEHAQVVALEDIPRFAELGVVASVQPTHATSDMPWAEDRVGPARIAGAYAWRKLRAAGIPLACGSDFPIEDPNPFHGLHAAVTRQDAEGNPVGGWRPEERMTRAEALACFTRDAAAAARDEAEVGRIAVGLRADFLVLDGDPMTVPAASIRDLRPTWTVIEGRTAHGAPPEAGTAGDGAAGAGR